MPRNPIAQFRFNRGYATDVAEQDNNGFMTVGSVAAMADGADAIRPFRGLTLDVSSNGSRDYFLVDGAYAGLGEFGGVGKIGQGSIFKAYNLLLIVGQGKIKVAGKESVLPHPTLAFPSTGGVLQATGTLSYIQRHSTGAFIVNDANGVLLSKYGQVGHERPSKPNAYTKSPPSAGRKTMNAAVVVAVWRVDSITGQVSNKSESSDVLQVNNGSVIIQVASANANNQDRWGFGGTRLGLSNLGNIYTLPVEIGGEITEASLSYQRAIAGASIANASNSLSVTAGTGTFGSQDLGRRITIGTFSSWVKSVTSADSVILNETNTGLAITAQNGIIQHAIDGALRAVELSWSDDELIDLAPVDAFPPPSAKFAGGFFDVVFVEDAEGTILYSIPNYLGSFPRSRRIITNEKSVCYLQESEGAAWRIGKQSIGQLSYVGGEIPLQYEQKIQGMGCKFPSNASVGANGNILLYSRTPVRIFGGETIDVDFTVGVESEFADFINQTEDKPVVTAFDPVGKYEMWCYGTKIMARHNPSNRWCAPIYIDSYVPVGSVIVGKVVIDQRLYLTVNDGTALKHYLFDSGTGTDMTLVSTNIEVEAETATVTQFEASIKTDGDLFTAFDFFIVKNERLAQAIKVGTFKPTATPELQTTPTYKPNVRGCKRVGVKIVITSADKSVTVKGVNLYGDFSQIIQ